MKKLIKVAILTLVALFSAASFAKWHGCQEQNLIFFAYNIKHTKAVELCQTEEGYRYTFGPIGKPEIILKKIATMLLAEEVWLEDLILKMVILFTE
ncbi:hypothetical protein O1M93_27195 [Klebsiella pneumoniae]|uniref:hypothetical protein n=1 Tax=Klebsiella pneumoniae TaxID=573 RepID=UPI0023D84F59|nr:hypothetical protein [Klebsiella pneumoniae]MDF0741457.1 hypothetical protein [Klebsiella pneumoniae]